MQHPLGVGGTKSILHRCLTEQNADPGLHAPGSVGSFLNPKSSIRNLLLAIVKFVHYPIGRSITPYSTKFPVQKKVV